MQRSTLLLFLATLIAIAVFSAAAGFASIFWHAPSKAEIAEAMRKRDSSSAQANKTGTRSNNNMVHNVDENDEDDEDNSKPPHLRNEYKNGTLTGRVTDGETGKPVAGAKIQIQYYTDFVVKENGQRDLTAHNSAGMRAKPLPVATTDADGHYQIEVPPSVGSVVISINANRYDTRTESINFEGTGTQDFELAPVPGLIIRVTDAQGNRINNFKATAVKAGFLGLDTSRRTMSVNLQPGDEAFLSVQAGSWDVYVIDGPGKLRSKTKKVQFDGNASQVVELVVEEIGDTPKKGSSR